MADVTRAPKTRPLAKQLKAATNWPGKASLRFVERAMGRASLVGDTPVLPRGTFPFVAELEANWRTIRDELETVIAERDRMPTMQTISKTQRKIIKTDGWKTYFFTAYGERAEENCRRCPKTAALLDKVPNLELAFFSILEPGSHIRAHRGVFKGLIRGHLGLKVPEPREKCRMRVGDEMVVWREGECVMFDDTYEHEIWNETDGTRVVLLFDVRRPLPRALDAFNRSLLRAARVMPFVREPIRQHRAWEKGYYGGQGGR